MSDDATNPAAPSAPNEGGQAGVAPPSAETRGGGASTSRGTDSYADGQSTDDRLADDGPTGDDEFEEIDYEGKRYSIPKPLKDGVLRHRDYTQKTQELAEQRRQHEAERHHYETAQRVYAAHRSHIARLEAVNHQLRPLEAVDWATLSRVDPAGAHAAFMEYNRLKSAREHLAFTIAQREHHSALEGQRQSATRLEKAQAVLARDIPNWSQDLWAKLSDYALSKGITRQELAEANDARHIKVLHAAWVGEQLLSKQRAADAGAPNAEPVPQVGRGGSPVIKSPERMSTEEWMKWRTSQLRKKGRR